MAGLKVKYCLCFAVLMLTLKPFIGFSYYEQLKSGTNMTILIKAFSKRKQEFNETSESHPDYAQQRLANPPVSRLLLFSSLLNIIFPFAFGIDKKLKGVFSDRLASAIDGSLPLYLLSGKLTI
ncbi:hypothetical protein [Mucilaginibacter oryzae]|nr:hypothetical protein [Mucilaginibacter oryzae]